MGRMLCRARAPESGTFQSPESGMAKWDGTPFAEDWVVTSGHERRGMRPLFSLFFLHDVAKPGPSWGQVGAMTRLRQICQDVLFPSGKLNDPHGPTD